MIQQETKGFWPLIKLIPIKTNFRLMRFARPLALVSLVLTIASIGVTLYPFKPPCGGLACGVDFTGGTVMEVSTAPKAIDTRRLDAIVSAQGVTDVTVQGIGAEGQPQTAATVRFKTAEGVNGAEKNTQIQNVLRSQLGQVAFTRTEVVGPSVSGELFGKGLLALALGVSMMMTYIWFRFGRSFGVGAALALIHDVVLTFGSYLIPLAVLELYFAAQRAKRPGLKLLATAVVGLAALFTAAGVFGTVTLMWLPEL